MEPYILSSVKSQFSHHHNVDTQSENILFFYRIRLKQYTLQIMKLQFQVSTYQQEIFSLQGEFYVILHIPGKHRYPALSNLVI